ncbi:putative cleavage and polyadenylation specificity factor subunit 2 [Thelohanellus kitauei]|uniref:Cleavage and polyadenylation specificity factor subunit 2 n=1 Tax=Thelohanellus kitauei TaxID=669202 RepID=A0A0C2I8Y1_THEKT|nr:putative cleavage and polyadenylation specificity factor subunit 2 [Thelohanellus kitauei]
MSNEVEFTPLFDSDGVGPLCHLLEVENIKILLDCGWDIDTNPAILSPIAKIAHEIEIVLLSACDFRYIGAYPYLFGRHGLTCPSYATHPVSKMGHLLLYDYYQSMFEVHDPNFTLDQVDESFKHITQVKFSQKIYLRSSGFRISVTAIPSGMSIGSSMWLVEIDGGESRVVYAPHVNHQNDRHLNAMPIDIIIKPTVFITSSIVMNRSFVKKSTKETEIKDLVTDTIKAQGNVMIVTDTSARSLEMLLLINEIRESDELFTGAEFYFVSHVSHHVVEFAKFQLEWMNSTLLKNFQMNSKNPFSLGSLNTPHNFEALNPSRPSVILVSDICIERGKGFKFFASFLSSPSNCVIFTKPKHFKLNYGQVIDVEITERVLDFSKSYQNNPATLDGVELASTDDEAELESAQNVSRLQKPKFIYSGVNSRLPWDAYGEDINPNNFLPVNEGLNSKQISFKSQGLVEALSNVKCLLFINLVDPSVIPFTFGSETLTIQVKYTLKLFRAKLVDILMDGLIDSDSLCSIIKMISPRNLIVINGSQEDNEKLKNYAISQQINTFTPEVIKKIRIVDDKKLLQVSFQEPLASSLNFVECKGHQVSWIDFMIKKSSRSNTATSFALQCTNDNATHSSLFLNEIKLSELSQLLIQHGYNVRFKNGILLYKNGKVAIRKKKSGDISLSGTLSKEYFEIRKLIYSQLCII